jgi:hypothetical protein
VAPVFLVPGALFLRVALVYCQATLLLLAPRRTWVKLVMQVIAIAPPANRLKLIRLQH